jgi:predicted transcriptional regulator
MDTTTLGIKVDEKTRERLKALGRKKDRATHWLIKKAIDEYLEREELAERERREDEKRWERYEATGESISHEKVLAWLDDLAVGKQKSWRR